MAHQLQLQLASPGPPLTNPPSHIQYPISSYPLEKYSFSVTHASETGFSSSQIQWTHYANRDNLYFVIDISATPSLVQSTYLKVIWGTQILEYLDFTALSNQTLPTANPHNPPQPAILSVAKVPCLAVRYPGRDGLTIRRFQVRFPTETIFDTVKHRLESLNFPIQAQQNPLSRDGQNQPLGVPPQYTTQFPGPPTNSYHHGSAVANIGPHMSQVSHTPQAPLHNSQVPPARNMAPLLPINYPSYPMQPQVAVPTFTYSLSPLPPPRQLPDFSGLSLPTSAGIDTESILKKVIPIEDLTPLRKPTPVKKAKGAPGAPGAPRAPKAPRATRATRAPKTPRAPRAPKAPKAPRAPRAKGPVNAKEAATPKPSSSCSGSFIEKAPEDACSSTVLHQKPPGRTPFTPQLPDASPINSESGLITKERRPQMRLQVPTSDFVFRSSPPPLPYKKAHTTPPPPDESNKRVRFQVSASPEPVTPAPLPNLSNAISASKGKGKVADASSHDNIGTLSPLREPMDSEVNTEARTEQERFRALENLIVDKIHDEDFCKLLGDVSRVWQRMGFEHVFKEGELFGATKDHQ